ncbi:MAG: glycosyltransferase family 4 protein [archaeon]
MRVLMFGWEFPPLSSGGLGTACYGLTKGLSNEGVSVSFVLPAAHPDSEYSHLKIIRAEKGNNIRIRTIDSPMVEYVTVRDYRKGVQRVKRANNVTSKIYGEDLFAEVYRYSEAAREIASYEEFDIIHAHDWITYQAGINAKEVSGKPLVVHVHATEFDRTGGSPNQAVYDLEKAGMEKADAVIAVSNYTKAMILRHYGIPGEKVHVVYNAVFHEDAESTFRLGGSEKVVLFLGRITLQKGPEYFLYAAKRVLDQDSNVRFIMAGAGDMESFIIEKAAELGIGDKVLFTGFLSGGQIRQAYQMADLFVMPSVSEPFGIAALEAISNGTPVIISKQSGVSEVIRHCLTVDFWDVEQMSNKILAALNYRTMNDHLRTEGAREVRRLTWDSAAQQCKGVYACLV